jgi:hypothetical protein
MKSSETEIAAILGAMMDGGYYAGHIHIDGQLFALIVAPKVAGEFNAEWIADYKDVPGATSYYDGLANTIAMAEAGSELANLVRSLDIGGNKDWYIPSQDELEIIYRNLKPTTDTNSLYGRSGVNVSAAVPTSPYTRELPAQTLAEAFQAGGAEAFEPDWYWSSTQHAGYSVCAWGQGFNHGYQGYGHKSYGGRARAVRRLPI